MGQIESSEDKEKQEEELLQSEEEENEEETQNVWNWWDMLRGCLHLSIYTSEYLYITK